MKKSLIAFLLILTMMLPALIACHKDEKDSNSDSGQSQTVDQNNTSDNAGKDSQPSSEEDSNTGENTSSGNESQPDETNDGWTKPY